MSDNWIVQNLENALNTWNDKLAEIWKLVTQTPETFKGGSIWKVIVNINSAMQGIGLALLVLFFLVGVVKTCSSFDEVKKPEKAFKLFIRFALAKIVVVYGMDLMLSIFKISQGIISTIMKTAGINSAAKSTLPKAIAKAVESCGFFESIPLWAVTLIGGLVIIVLSFIMIMTVYGRFFKLYLYTAIAESKEVTIYRLKIKHLLEVDIICLIDFFISCILPPTALLFCLREKNNESTIRKYL